MEEERRGGGEVAVLQDEIQRLPGVLAARVVGTSGGRISEIHVVACGDKPPKQVVRDIQTLAMARLGLDVDYRTVSVVCLDAAPQQPSPQRPVLASLSWHLEGGRATCRVEVLWGDRRGVGEAAGSPHQRLRLAAKATEQAVAEVDGGGAHIEVADVILTEVGGLRVAVASVVLAGSSEEVLVGAAPVRTDEVSAAARAVLAALNRRLPAAARPGR